MKKFLSKMPVMITLLSLAVVGLVFYVVMLARPVSYGMTYTYTHTVSEDEASLDEPAGTTIGMKMQIMSDKRAYMTVITDLDTGKSEMMTEIWIIRNGNQIAMITSSMTEEEYDQAIEELKADEAAWNALWAGEDPSVPIFEINSFRILPPVADGEVVDTMICNDAIVFAVVWGVIELALITFGVLSLVFYKKGDKSTPAETTESAEVA